MKLIGLRILDCQIERIYEATNLLRVSAGFGQSQVLMMDYELNLSHRDAQEAYIRAINQYFTLDYLKWVNPETHLRREIPGSLVDLTYLDEIIQRKTGIGQKHFVGRLDTPFRQNLDLKIGVLAFE